MKRLLYLSLAALMVLAVSCKKDEKNDTKPGTGGDEPLVLGYWKVESENASLRGQSDLCYAWYNYFYNELDEAGVYSILFLPTDDKDHWKDYDYVYLCLPISKEGKNLNLADNLNEQEHGDFAFFAGTKTIFIGNESYTGSMSLNVDRENNSIAFKLDGTSPDGDKVKIEYDGPATPVTPPPFDYTDIFEE